MKRLIDRLNVHSGDVPSVVTTGLSARLHFATLHFMLVNVGLVACLVKAFVLLNRLCAEPSDTFENGDAHGLALT